MEFGLMTMVLPPVASLIGVLEKFTAMIERAGNLSGLESMTVAMGCPNLLSWVICG